MPILTPSVGGEGACKDHLKASFADTTMFQEICGASTAEEAAEHVFIDALESPAGEDFSSSELMELRPFIDISTQDYRRYRVSTPPGGMTDAGRLLAVLEVNTESLLESHETLDSVGNAELERRLENIMSAIIEYGVEDVTIESLAADGNRFVPDAIEPVDVFRCRRELVPTQGDFMRIRKQFIWNGGGRE